MVAAMRERPDIDRVDNAGEAGKEAVGESQDMLSCGGGSSTIVNASGVGEDDGDSRLGSGGSVEDGVGARGDDIGDTKGRGGFTLPAVIVVDRGVGAACNTTSAGRTSSADGTTGGSSAVFWPCAASSIIFIICCWNSHGT